MRWGNFRIDDTGIEFYISDFVTNSTPLSYSPLLLFFYVYLMLMYYNRRQDSNQVVVRFWSFKPFNILVQNYGSKVLIIVKFGLYRSLKKWLCFDHWAIKLIFLGKSKFEVQINVVHTWDVKWM